MNALFPQIDKPARLEVTNLTMARGSHTLFQDLSARVTPSDVLWVQGDNGIGKTTLLEALAGLSRPDGGDVSWFEGEQLTFASQLVAYQPHKSYAKASLTAKEDLAFWAKIYDTSSLVAQSLDYVGLSTREDVHSQNLSAGQRRRLSLAKLIVSQKPIWIMDEPGAAMDSSGITLIDSLISQHIERGGSAIIASHDTTRKLSAKTRKLTLRSEA